MSKKILIMADNQIGMMPEGRPELAEDFVIATKWACALARETPDCIGIAVAGDMRDTPHIPGEQFGWLMDIMDECGDKPLSVLCGNHDMTQPNWVKTATRRINGIYDLTTPQGVEVLGLDPKNAFGLDYKNPIELEKILSQRLKSGETRTLFLHQAFAEFGAARFSDIHIEAVRRMIPDGCPLTIFAGDIHNYGDTQSADGLVRAFSPGSLQMTDVNEGFNGLPSKIYPKLEDCDQKFILWYDLQSHQVTRQAIPPHILRPWHYAKLRDGISNIPEILMQKALAWASRPRGIIELKVPPNELNRARTILEQNPGLVQPFDKVRIRTLPDARTEQKLADQEAGAAPEELTRRQNWVNTELLSLASEEVNAGRMSAGALDLLNKLCEAKAGSKREIQLAVHDWNKGRLNLGEIAAPEAPKLEEEPDLGLEEPTEV
jgi:hypothetical protein